MFEETIPGGWNWSHRLKAGTALRLTDLEGGACAAVLLYNPLDYAERYNMPDTLKAQFISGVGLGTALYSDMGRILATVIEDSVGGHDTIAGLMNREGLAKRFGYKDYQAHRNAYDRSGADALLTELGKYGLGFRDLAVPINFFCRLVIDAEGRTSFGPTAPVGATVTIQAEMDCLVVVAATQHPLDPRTSWQPRPARAEVFASQIAPEKNPAWQASEQNKRGFENTRRYQI